jgi:ABC-type lipoprotein release transport system permease subunit
MLALAAVVVFGSAVFAVWLPMREALKIDPIETLKTA